MHLLTVWTLSAICAASATPDSPWGEGRGCLRGDFTRAESLRGRGRSVEPLDEDTPFTLRFRFQTVDKGSYAGFAFVGVRRDGGTFNTNGAGVAVFRHNDTLGLVANAFLADSAGNLDTGKGELVSLEYGTVYDVSCSWTPSARTITAEFTDAESGEKAGADTVHLADGARWHADTLACWNYADGHNPNSRLSLLIDSLQLDDEPPLTFDGGLEEMPLAFGEGFEWHSAPAPPVISSLQGPTDVFDFGADYTVQVRADVSGAVDFTLMTFAGKTLWTARGFIEDGVASARLGGATAAGLEKGAYVLAAVPNSDDDEAAYKAVRMRGRVFHNPCGTPKDLQPGDEIVLTDMARLEPSRAVSARSERGKWWRRTYTLDGVNGEHSLVCIEEQDPDDPRSCLAPPIVFPLDLEGWFEVWVLTYRHEQGGGVDVRFSDEPYFLHMDPLQVALDERGQGWEPGALVELRFRAADLTGRDLLFQQPFGTYESQTMLCNASFAGLRLVKLSDAQTAGFQEERQRQDTKIIGYDNDGFSYFHRWAEHDPACIARLIEPLRGQSVSFFNYELGGLGGLFIPTPYTGMYQMTGHTRHGDYRANEFFQWCFENDVNIVDILAERAHEVGVDLYVSLMLQRCFSPDDVMKAHRDWRVQLGPGTWDYANPEVQQYQVDKVRWIMENHDIDGFIVDFTRYGHHFNKDEPDKFGHMNRFLRKVRAATDEVNAKKQRNVKLCASFGDRSWHLTHWGSGKLEDQGLDVRTWLDEGLFDRIMPEGPNALDYVEMAKGASTEVWPRFVSRVTIKEHTSVKGGESPKAIERGILWAYEQGAPGIFLFNHEPWSTFRRLGFRDELPLRARTDFVYGMREASTVSFTTWFPSVPERAAQRDAVPPVPVELDADGNVDAEAAFWVRNTFKHPVTVRAAVAPPDEKAGQGWTASPERLPIDLAPGASREFRFRLASKETRPGTGPRISLEYFSEDGQRILLHRVPVRAVAHAACTRVASTGELGGRTGHALRPVGGKEASGDSVHVTFGRDEEHFFVSVAFPGGAPEGVERRERDSKETLQDERAIVLIDSAGTEQRFLEFVATPGGSQRDVLHHYDAFLGHFARKPGWNPEWQVRTTGSADTHSINFAIPFKAVGSVPKAGARWRVNVIAAGSPGRGSTAMTWAPVAERISDPACMGVVGFE